MSWASAAGAKADAWPCGTSVTLSLGGGRVVSGTVVAANADVLALQQAASGAATGDRALTLVNLTAVEKVTERTPPPAGFQAEVCRPALVARHDCADVPAEPPRA